jgi:hypothetical protein
MFDIVSPRSPAQAMQVHMKLTPLNDEFWLVDVFGMKVFL